MEIEYGAEVVDKNGKRVGTVDHLMHNTWTGEISKFVVRSKVLDKDLVISTQDLLEVTKTKVRLNISIDELS